MRKLIVSCGNFTSGGAERVLSILSESFADNFEEVIYLSWIDAPDFYNIDCRIKRICVEKECRSKYFLKKIHWFRTWVIKQDPDLLLSFLEPFNILICAVLIDTRIPIVISNRSDNLRSSFARKILRNITFKRANGIVFQTHKNRNYFKNYIFNNSTVIYNPVFLSNSYLGKSIYSKKENIIVSVGRLEKVKNHKMLIDAFKEFYRSYPNYKLVIYGEGSQRNELINYINSLKLESVILLPGAKNDVWDRIYKSKCFVLTSRYEGMPNALIEAMCLGIPSISTPVSGATELIENGINGFLVEHNDVKRLVSLMEQIVKDENLSNFISNNAIKIYDKLNIDTISKEWIDYLYSKINKQCK